MSFSFFSPWFNIQCPNVPIVKCRQLSFRSTFFVRESCTVVSQCNLSRIVWFQILFAVFQDLPDSAASSRWSSSRCARSTGNLHTATGSHSRANRPHTKWSTTAAVGRYNIDNFISVAWRLIARASIMFLVQDAASYVVLQTLCSGLGRSNE